MARRDAATLPKVAWLSLLALGVLAAAIVAGLLIGPTRIDVGRVLAFDQDSLDARKVFGYRLPRAFASAIIGAALSVAGLVFQALIRNPLASPYVLGVSTGGSLGAVIALTAGFAFVPGAAFVGSCLAIILIYGASRGSGGRIPSVTLLLSGVVLNAFFSAGIMFVNLMAAPRDQDRILRWLIGGLQDRYEPATLLVSGGCVAAIAAVALAWSRELNLLSLSETDADRAGVRVTRLRTAFFGLGSLLTAIAVTISGPIAFVGLIVPHIVRLLAGPDHRLLVPLCTLGGGAFLVVVDALAQSVWSSPLPAGVITAFLGGPFFLILSCGGAIPVARDSMPEKPEIPEIRGGIAASGVAFSYRDGRPVLRGVDLDLWPGSFTALMGPNGCGKSTLLRVLAGLLAPAAGSVSVAGLDLLRATPRARARTVGWLPQSEPLDLPFLVRELVVMGLYPLQGRFPFDRAEDLARAEAALAAVGAAEFGERRLAELSGGERQRAALARVLAPGPLVLLLDEPAANLDARHQIETYRLIRRINREEGRTVLLVSHDFNLPASFADVVALMKDGRIVRQGPPAEILRASVLEGVYEVAFHEAWTDGLDHPLLVPKA